MTRWVVVVAAIALSPCAAAWAQKTDVITLLNGDRITGEIKNLERGVLEFSTDDAGTIDIEWDKVGTVEAKRSFEVETSDGRRMLGTLGPPVQRTLSVGTVDGVVALPMAEVTRITPIGRTFWAKLDGTVDAGFTYTHSSGVAQTTFNTTTLFRRPAYLFRLYSSATVTKRNDGTGDDDRSAVRVLVHPLSRPALADKRPCRPGKQREPRARAAVTGCRHRRHARRQHE